MPKTLEEFRKIARATEESLRHKGWKGLEGHSYPTVRCDACDIHTPHAMVGSGPIDDKGGHRFQCLACDLQIVCVIDQLTPEMVLRKVEERKIIGFDIEIASELPEDYDWTGKSLGISCMAIWESGHEADVWYDDSVYKGMYGERMSPGAVSEVADWLYEMQAEKGYKIITLNGAGFDFRIMARECFPGSTTEHIKEMVYDHIDLGFQMLCEKGFMIGLDTLGKGLGLAGKMEGMEGALAPLMWAKDRESQEIVLEYVAADAKLTGRAYEELLKKGSVRWTTKKGVMSKQPWTPNFMGTIREKGRLLTVREAMRIARPNTHWMDNPLSRDKCVRWLEEDDAS